MEVDRAFKLKIRRVMAFRCVFSYALRLLAAKIGNVVGAIFSIASEDANVSSAEDHF